MSAAVAAAAPAVRPLKQNRTFQLILAGHLVSILGDGFHSVALGIWVLQTTGSARAMSAVMVTKLLVNILLGAIGGTVADRFDRRRLMWSMDLVRGLLVLGIALLVGRPGSPFAAVVALTALTAVAGVFRGPAFSASLVHIVGAEHVQQAGSLMQMLSQVAQVAGPLLGGLVAAALSGSAALLGDAASFFFCALMVLLAGNFPSPVREGAAKKSFWGDLKAGLTYIRTNPFARSVVILAPMLNFFANGIGVLLPVLAVKVWKASPVAFGSLEGAIPLGFALGAAAIMAMDKRLRRRGLWMGGGMILTGPLMVLMALVPGVIPAVPVALVIGIVLSLSNVLLMVAMQTQIDPEVQGRVFGTMGSLVQVASPLSMVAAGFLGDFFGPIPIIIAAGVGMGVTGIIGITAMKAIRTYN